MAGNSEPVFVFRLNSDESERILFVRRWTYVGLKRDWRKGSKILFARKSDAFFGYGIVATVKQSGDLEPAERRLCLQRNWSAKLYFSTLARLDPPVLRSETPLASQSPLTLHGSETSEEVATRIEELAAFKIIT